MIRQSFESELLDKWLQNSARRVVAVKKLSEIPELSDEYAKIYNMIYSGDEELISLAENIIKQKGYEKTKCYKIENKE